MKQLEPMPKFNNGENLGAFVISLTNPFLVNMKASYEDAVNLYSVEMEVLSGTIEGDKQSQLETLEAMASKTYDSLIVSPIEPYNLVPAIVKANDKKYLSLT